ncbi:F-box only protein 13-like [Nymphaea colorata]|uniref:F-box domain-containing protein n=1 Tax=Nymphaea colorata TaxID=210225 RepID=A0A5K1CQ80_9MAGN|nr:F-box only protein 13-like [Nymphaea colorata]
MDMEFFSVHKRPTTTICEGSGPRKRKKKSKDKHQLEHVCEPNDEAQWGDLDDGVLELVLARLPVSDFFRFRSVCKGWSSLIRSPSFLTACSEVSLRGPWFYMLDSKSDSGVIYDMDVGRWRHISFLSTLTGPGKLIPVAAAGGLICFRSPNGDLSVCNPLTGSCRELPPLNSVYPIHAIAMHASKSSYRIVVIFGEILKFGVKVYTSSEKQWVELPVSGSIEDAASKLFEKQTSVPYDDGAYIMAGPSLNDIRLSMTKEFSAVGGEVIHFLNGNGRVVACDTRKGTMYSFPAILPPDFEYSVDIVECRGRVLLVVLLEMMETATIRVWEFQQAEMEWVQVLAMPPAMSNTYYGKKADINCVGYGDFIMVCISSRRFHRVVLCNVTNNLWAELPRCYVPGSRKIKRFVSCFCFEPRIEARV